MQIKLFHRSHIYKFITSLSYLQSNKITNEQKLGLTDGREIKFWLQRKVSVSFLAEAITLIWRPVTATEAAEKLNDRHL